MSDKVLASDIDATAVNAAQKSIAVPLKHRRFTRRLGIQRPRSKSVIRQLMLGICSSAVVAGGIGALGVMGALPYLKEWLKEQPVSELMEDWAYRWRVHSMPANTFNIVVADLINDDEQKTNTNHIVDALYEQLDATNAQSAVRAEPANRLVQLVHRGDSHADQKALEAKGHWLLKLHNGDVLVWGEVNRPGGGQPASLSLHFIPKEGESSIRAKGYLIGNNAETATVELPPNFGSDLASAIKGVALTQGEKARIDGRSVDETLEALVPKLEHLIEKPPQSLDEGQMIGLRETYAMAAGRVGDQRENKAMLVAAAAQWKSVADHWKGKNPEHHAKALSHLGLLKANIASLQGGDKQLYGEAIASYDEALDAIKDGTPNLLWAMAQSNRADALRALGEIEEENGRVVRSVQMFRDALTVLDSLSEPQWKAITLNHLGDALRALGEQQDGTDLFNEAKASLDSALAMLATLPDGDVATLRPETQSNLGDVWKLIGVRTKDPKALETSISFYDGAVKQWASLKIDRDWAASRYKECMSVYELGKLQSDLGKLRSAVKMCREALQKLSRTEQPALWAEAELALGRAVARIGETEGYPTRLEEARGYVAAAIETFKLKGASRDVALAQRELDAIGQALTPTGSIRY